MAFLYFWLIHWVWVLLHEQSKWAKYCLFGNPCLHCIRDGQSVLPVDWLKFLFNNEELLYSLSGYRSFSYVLASALCIPWYCIGQIVDHLYSQRKWQRGCHPLLSYDAPAVSDHCSSKPLVYLGCGDLWTKDDFKIIGYLISIFKIDW